MKTKKIIADKVQVGDTILLHETKFRVDDIQKFFINDEVAEQYGDNDDVAPEDSMVKFYYEHGIVNEQLEEDIIMRKGDDYVEILA